MLFMIVKSDFETGGLWKLQLEKGGSEVILCDSQDSAVAILRDQEVRVIVLDLDLKNGSALAVADFANYRRPEAKIIFVTHSGVFSDGSIFNHVQNACAYLPSTMNPEDMAALVEHYGSAPDPG